MRQNGVAGEPLRRMTDAVITYEMSKRSRAQMEAVFDEIKKDRTVESASYVETPGQHGIRFNVKMTCLTHGCTNMTPMTVLDRARKRASKDDRGHIFYGSWIVNKGVRTDVPNECTKEHGEPCESCRMRSCR